MTTDTNAPLRTLIVDDEPLAIERMATLCGKLDSVQIVGAASNGALALTMIDALKPDLLLLDIAMPEMDGLTLARVLAGRAGETERHPAIIFVTAFDNFAVEAFDTEAIDYLLKPVAAERLDRAIARVGNRQGGPPPEVETSVHVEEFWVPHRSELIRIAATDIDQIDAERDYMRLHVGARSYLLHQTIAALEQRLNPDWFIRLHRSTIVRRDRIARLGHDGAGAWHAELTDGKLARIGRTYLARVKTMAGR
jgi:two-component system, LytTR family, response regulator AlgR